MYRHAARRCAIMERGRRAWCATCSRAISSTPRELPPEWARGLEADADLRARRDRRFHRRHDRPLRDRRARAAVSTQLLAAFDLTVETCDSARSRVIAYEAEHDRRLSEHFRDRPRARPCGSCGARPAAGRAAAASISSRIVVEPPREASHGDLATNAAMALAKDAGHEAARSRREDRGQAARRSDWSPRSRSPGRASST